MNTENVYYERKRNLVTFELCQNRFKNNPNHPHNVCAVATSHDQLKQMYDNNLSGGVDWLYESKYTGSITKRQALEEATRLYSNFVDSDFPEDTWYSLGENWDLNLWTKDDGELLYHATVYPVIDGNTDTSVFVTVM